MCLQVWYIMMVLLGIKKDQRTLEKWHASKMIGSRINKHQYSFSWNLYEMTNPQANLGDPITPSLGYYFLGLWGVEVKKCGFDWVSSSSQAPGGRKPSWIEHIFIKWPGSFKIGKICKNYLEISFYKWYPLFNRGSRSATLGTQMVQVSLGYYLLGLWGVEVKRCGFDWVSSSSQAPGGRKPSWIEHICIKWSGSFKNGKICRNCLELSFYKQISPVQQGI